MIVLRTEIVLILFVFVLANPVGASNYAYLFSREAKYIKIDISNDVLVDVGSLWWEGIFDINQVKAGPKNQEIYLLTSKAILKGDLNGPRRGFFVLKNDHKNNLRLYREIDISALKDYILSGFDFGLKENTMLVSWDEGEEGKTGLFEVDSFKKIIEISKNWASSDKCYDYEKNRLTVPWGREFLTYDMNVYKLIDRVDFYRNIGGANFFSKSYKDISNCDAVIVEYLKRPNSENILSNVYIYDLKHKKISLDLKINLFGHLKLISEKGLLLIDEKKLAGKTLKKLGKLYVFDLKKKQIVKTISLPEGGTNFWITPDNNKLYYLSQYYLTIVDLNNLEVIKNIDVPFHSAFMVFLKE